MKNLRKKKSNFEVIKERKMIKIKIIVKIDAKRQRKEREKI